MGFSLSTALDAEALARHFSEHGYVSIPNILPGENAKRLQNALSSFTDWNLVFNDRGKHIDLSTAQVHSMQPQAAHRSRRRSSRGIPSQRLMRKRPTRPNR